MKYEYFEGQTVITTSEGDAAVVELYLNGGSGRIVGSIDKTCSGIHDVLDSNGSIPLQLFIKGMIFHGKHRSIIKSISGSGFTKRRIFQSKLL